ncbi:MAG: CDP-alcohol phosphatidyltransferase family protein [Candidatus Binatia bacterium]|nr:CDP-alcohol phosphatidyltransferase family protein [Candidatus Binatia bacterium]
MLSTIPNALSTFRLAATPVLLILAWLGETALFLTLFAIALASDVLDGMLARRWKMESELGARLDQWADFAVWASFPLAAWWLWPEILVREAGYVILAVTCLLLPTFVGFLKYREVPGYHTWFAKTSAVAMGVAVPALLLFDVVWPFRAASLFLLIAAADELAITFLLPDCRHDIPSAIHARRMRGWR